MLELEHYDKVKESMLAHKVVQSAPESPWN